ncbi:hypothetical protein MRX96_051987 [Rhipicephalus microplus]
MQLHERTMCSTRSRTTFVPASTHTREFAANGAGMQHGMSSPCATRPISDWLRSGGIVIAQVATVGNPLILSVCAERCCSDTGDMDFPDWLVSESLKEYSNGREIIEE